MIQRRATGADVLDELTKTYVTFQDFRYIYIYEVKRWYRKTLPLIMVHDEDLIMELNKLRAIELL